MSEARTVRIEEDVGEIKAAIVRLEPLINRIAAVLPHLATKEELGDLRGETRTGFADLRGEMRTEFASLRGQMSTALAAKPSHAYLWGVMGAMVGGQAVILAAAALALVILQAPPRAAPSVPSTPAPHASGTTADIVLAAEAFDWDRYDARQDACREKDRIAAQCGVERNPVFNSFVRRGVPEEYCDELALRQAQRQCLAFGPLGDKRPR
jgi:hypothetical protein